MSSKQTILVSGKLAAALHQGGAAWVVLQFVLGFRELGHSVYFLEHVRSSALNPVGSKLPDSKNAEYFWKVVEKFGLSGHCSLVDPDTSEVFGSSRTRVEQALRRTDVLLNLGGSLPIDGAAQRIPIRVYLDLDPCFTQLWGAAQGLDMGIDSHTHHVSIGLSLGSEYCLVPSLGIDWKTTLQPVVLRYWQPVPGTKDGPYSTVANWRSYGSVESGGVVFGQKAHSWRALMNLPSLTRKRILVALSIHPEERRDLLELESNGWELVDPHRVAGTPADYRDFIARSRGELAIAKSGYVLSRCGWFSDRSACYLASGKPVIAQSTGFEDFLPSGKGLFSFVDTQDIVQALEMIESGYDEQASEARVIAHEFFDSRKVLPGILRHVGVCG